jgi:lipopolysaccharide/colanic/teichoic acid biosynthesis glycosyltransferase
VNTGFPFQKRAFDVAVGLAMGLAILPLLLVVSGAIALLEGRPVLYVSRRRLDHGQPQRILKFRTMRRDAERIANRDSVPVIGTRFLNLPIDSPLYTSVGRFIERLMLTEMPQLLHVLSGRMTIVGNRPLPENVVRSLAEEFPDVEDRFLVRGGLTGPVQLVGRDHISDEARLEIEIAYCRTVLAAYSPMLDLKILALTITSGFWPGTRYTPDDVMRLLARYGGPQAARRREARRPVPPPAQDEGDALDPGAPGVRQRMVQR